MMSSTKEGEIHRTCEVCLDILGREGVNYKGLFFLIHFLRDQGRPLEEILPILEREIDRLAKLSK